MAVNTKQKRMAAETFLKMWHPWVFPDVGGVTANERAALAGAYGGLFAGPIAPGTLDRRRLLLLHVR
jgi:hypothetical protein